ncbi:MAG: glutamine amidotransferase [Galactobacter sp.]
MSSGGSPKPFLLISTRPEDDVVAGELRGVTELAGLAPGDVVQHRLERDAFSPVPGLKSLRQYSGVILGGSPFTSTDPEPSALQERVEGQLVELVSTVLEHDLPFLGLCYGVGILGRAAGGVVDRTYPEPVGPSTIQVTDEGAADPVLAGMPKTFTAFVGHKEAMSALPSGATLLATSGPAPVQMFKLGSNVYATQFHPELDGRGLAQRIDAYKHHGYFDPSEATALTEIALSADVSHARAVLSNFVRRYSN